MSISYKVISDVRGHNQHSVDRNFEERVSAYLNDGWELNGSVVISLGEKVIAISQSIVRSEPNL